MFTGKRPTNIGVQSGKLAPCPNTPNCVNSQSQDPKYQIEPLSYSSTPAEVMTKLKTVIENQQKHKNYQRN